MGTGASLSEEGNGEDYVDDGPSEDLMIVDTTSPLGNAALLVASHDIVEDDLITMVGPSEEFQQLVGSTGGITSLPLPLSRE